VFKRILLRVDLADRHGPALAAAAELAARGEGTVTLLHVIETIAGLSMEEEGPFYRRLERAARAHLDRLGKELAAHATAWQAEVRYGRRAAEAARYAAEMAADLVILTAPPFDPANPGAGWGSLSYVVGMLSACPVLLVK
jgi:nucleotide-binding universal stress UspA family protein